MSSSERWVGREEIAFLMGVEVRTVSNYVKKHEDFPSRKKRDGSREFPVKRCLYWQRDRIVADTVATLGPKKPTDLYDAERRKAIADAELAEIKVARARAEVVPVAAVATLERERYGRIRSTVLAKRGEYRDEFLNLATLAETDAKLAQLCDDILSELQSGLSASGDLPGDNDPEDQPPANEKAA